MADQLQRVRATFGDRVAFCAFHTDVGTEAGKQFLRGIQLQGIPALGCCIHSRLHEMEPGMRTHPALEDKLCKWLQVSAETP